MTLPTFGGFGYGGASAPLATQPNEPWWQQFMPTFGTGGGSAGGGNGGPGSTGGGGGGKKKKKKSAGMPYDADYRDALLALQAQRSTFFDELHRQQQTLRRQYQQGRADVEKQKPYAFSGLLNNFAGRGMAHGSGYVGQNVALNKQFADTLARMSGDFSFQKGQLLDQRGTYLDNYQTQMDLLRRAATRRLAQQAGDLGLGK